MIGDSIIIFDEYKIEINNVIYLATKGLLELLLKKSQKKIL